MRRSTQQFRQQFRIALWASALAHLLLFIGLEALSEWLKNRPESVQQTSQELALLENEEEEALDLSLIYVDVNPDTATDNAPENAEFYSSQNAEAADMADPSELDQPLIDGSQSDVMRLRNSPNSQAEQGAQATATEISNEAQASAGQPEAKDETQQNPEDVGGWLGEVDPNSEIKSVIAQEENVNTKTAQTPAGDVNGEKTPTPQRPPRTLAEAQMRQASMESEMTLQEGGVNKFSLEPSVNTVSTLYGEYDAYMFRIIEKHWHNILRSSTARGIGRVHMKFRLHRDGRITGLKIGSYETSQVLALFCQRAIQETAPHAPWPEEMVEEIGANFRDMEIDFHYH